MIGARAARSAVDHLDAFRVGVACVFALLVGAGAMWAVMVPPWQQPDDIAHFAYIEDIVRTGDLLEGLRHGSVGLDKSVAAAQYNQIASHPSYPGLLTASALDSARRQQAAIRASDQDHQTQFVSPASGYPPLYYAVAAAVVAAVRAMGAGYLVQLQSVRLVSVLIGAVSLAVQLQFLTLIFGRTTRALAGLALIAAMPMYVFMMSSINPDTMVIMWSSLVMLCVVRVIRSGIDAKWAALLVLGLGCDLLTKQSSYALAPAVVFALIVWTLSARRRRLRRSLVAVGLLLASIIPLLAYTMFAAAGGAAESAITSQGTHLVSLASLGRYLHLMRELAYNQYFITFWGNYGWADTSFPPSAYRWLLLGTVFVVVSVISCVLNSGRWRAEWVAIALAVVTLGGLLVAIEYVRVGAGLEASFIQGRYLFPLVECIAALVVVGCTAPFRSPRVGDAVLCAAVAAVIAFHVVTVTGLVLPRYNA